MWKDWIAQRQSSAIDEGLAELGHDEAVIVTNREAGATRLRAGTTARSVPAWRWLLER